MAQAADLSNIIFQFSRADLSQEVNLKPEEWRVLAQIDGLRPVRQIAQALGLDVPTVSQIADQLYRGGLLQVAPGSAVPPSPTVDGQFFDQVIRQLTLTMGPFASVVVEDEIEALGETREKFPRERIAELVERVGNAIDDENERRQFQKAMLNAIRKF